MDAKKYYSLESKNDVADLYIFGDITSWPWLESDVSASGIVNELQSLDVKEINVHINSYGGEVAEGLAIYNTLKNSDMDSLVPQHQSFLWQVTKESSMKRHCS